MDFKHWLEKEKGLWVKERFLEHYIKFYYEDYKSYCKKNKLKYQNIEEFINEHN